MLPKGKRRRSGGGRRVPIPQPSAIEMNVRFLQGVEASYDAQRARLQTGSSKTVETNRRTFRSPRQLSNFGRLFSFQVWVNLTDREPAGSAGHPEGQTFGLTHNPFDFRF